jgi:lipopolysaccharide export system permease protein
VLIIRKYLAGGVIKIFLIALCAVVSIYLVVDFFEKIDDFIEAGVPVSRAFLFFLLRIPFVVSQVTPVAVLLAVVIFLGLMARNNEIVALRSCGVSSYSLVGPLIVGGLAFSILLFFFAEVVVPLTMAKANRIWNVDVKKRIASFHEKNVWIKGHRSIFHIDYFNPIDETIAGVSLNFFDGEFNLIKRVDARSGAYREDEWILTECFEQKRLADGTYEVAFPERLKLNIDMTPESLKSIVKKSEEMSFKELTEYIRKVKAEGYNATPYVVDRQAKMAFPFVCLVMTLVGCAIALHKKSGEGLAMGITMGIGSAFLYWIIYSFCLSMGHNGSINPLAAAWLTNILFLAFSFLLLVRVEHV